MKTSVIVGLSALLAASDSLHAQSSPDWKLIGGTSDAYLFYDASRVTKLTNGHLQVWLKGLPATPTEKAAAKLIENKDYTDRVAAKVVRGYKPPLALTRKLNTTEIINGISDEEVANAAIIEPIIRMLVELDCPNRLSRHLSLYLKQGEKTGESEKVGEWEHIAPETNFDTLQMALCKAS